MAVLASLETAAAPAVGLQHGRGGDTDLASDWKVDP
jgi:hypothetical protein